MPKTKEKNKRNKSETRGGHKAERIPEEKKKKASLISVHGEKLGEIDPILSDAAIPEAILPDPVLPDIAPEDPLSGEEVTEDEDESELADIWEE